MIDHNLGDNLEALLSHLNFKIPFTEIPSIHHAALYDFLSQEREYRRQARVKALLRQSGLKTVKTLSQFDWSFNKNLPRQEIEEFNSLPWVIEAHNLVIIGDTGLGKSHIASSLCYEAILMGHRTCFINAFDLISKIKRSLNISTKIDTFANMPVLCIDELGYTHYQKEDTELIFQIISQRNEVTPTLITTNLPPKNWGSIFSGTAASAVLDRLSFRGKFITFEGRSYRLARKSRH
jgi:DNA replication protein DnaC